MATKSKRQNPETRAGNNGHAPIRYVAYLRVSSEEQRERGTIQTQLSVLEDYCKREGITLHEVYQDDGISGTVPFAERPSGSRLLQDARAKKFDCVLLFKFDRLGRNTLESLIATQTLERLGVNIKSVTEPFDTSTSAGRFMMTQLASVAQLERENIRERAISGMERTAKAGRWYGGHPPRGYRVNAARKLEPDDSPVENGDGMTEKELLQTIYRWIGDEHCSTLEVAQRLNARKIPVSYVKHGSNRGTSELWSAHTIGAIVHNPVYKGQYEFGRRAQKSGIQKYLYSVEPLVSADLWQGARATIAANRSHRPAKSHREYLLRGLLRCPLCGYGLTGMTARSGDLKHFYYRCHGKMSDIARQKGRCPSRLIPTEWLEQVIWDYVADRIVNHPKFYEAISKALRDVQGDRDQLQQQLIQAGKKIENLERDRQRVINWCLTGRIDERDLETKLAEVSRDRQTWQQQIEALQAQLDRASDPHGRLAHFHAHFDRHRDDIQRGTANKRQILEDVVKEVRVFGTPWKRREDEDETRGPIIHVIKDLISSLEPAQGERKTIHGAEDELPRKRIEVSWTFRFESGEWGFIVAKGSTMCRTSSPIIAS